MIRKIIYIIEITCRWTFCTLGGLAKFNTRTTEKVPLGEKFVRVISLHSFQGVLCRHLRCKLDNPKFHDQSCPSSLLLWIAVEIEITCLTKSVPGNPYII